MIPGATHRVNAYGAGYREADLSQALQRNDIFETVVYTFLTRLRIYQFHDTTEESRMRATCEVDDCRFLYTNGANLPAMLYRLRREHPARYERLLGTIRLAAPFLDDFVLEPVGNGRPYLSLRWRGRGREYEFATTGPKQEPKGRNTPLRRGAHLTPASAWASPQVKPLLGAFAGEKTREALGLRDRKLFRHRYLEPALTDGLVTMTLPDKPNSHHQRRNERRPRLLAAADYRRSASLVSSHAPSPVTTPRCRSSCCTPDARHSAPIAAARPAASPVTAHPGIARAISHPYPAADTQRPATNRLRWRTPCNAPKGRQNTGPGRLQSLIRPMPSSQSFRSTPSMVVRPANRRVIRRHASVGTSTGSPCAAASRRIWSRAAKTCAVISSGSSPA